MELISQRTTSAGLSSLEHLPVELFRQVTGYLAFFDRKAIQVTSKQCYFLTGHFICPDALLWTLHCCRSGIPCHPNSSIMSDILELYALTLDYVRRDTWLDLSQGREAFDAHWDFLDEWDDYISFVGIPAKYRQHILSLMGPESTTSGWHNTEPRKSRFKLRHQMNSQPCVLRPKWHFSTISPLVVVFEQTKVTKAPDTATYVDESHGISSFYISPILQPYFDKAFPMSSVAYFCLSVVDAKLMDRKDAPSAEQWEGEAQRQRWGEPNRLAERYCVNDCNPFGKRVVVKRRRRVFAQDIA